MKLLGADPARVGAVLLDSQGWLDVDGLRYDEEVDVWAFRSIGRRGIVRIAAHLIVGVESDEERAQ